MNQRQPARRPFSFERLETRTLLSATDLHPMIVAGDPNGSPPDSPAARVDANLIGSPFAGVGSVQISTNRGTYICTGTPFDATHVLTAAHCIDINNDGRVDKKDGIRSVKFNLNLDTDTPSDLIDVQINATAWETHPDYTGFNRPSVNDDLAVITLASSVINAGVPTYPLYTAGITAGTQLVMVGYGRSGDGVNGYTTNASWTIKRRGENIADAFYGQDDSGRAAANEVFRFDFDGPTGNGPLGGATLGNTTETTLGGGDSGGPSFVLVGGAYHIAGVNTFTQGSTAPKFGSMGGGINVAPYAGWILGPHGSSSAGGGGHSGHGGDGSPSSGARRRFVLVPDPSEADAAAASSIRLPDAVDRTVAATPAERPLEAPAAESAEPVHAPTASDRWDDSGGHRARRGLADALDHVLDDWRSVVI